MTGLLQKSENSYRIQYAKAISTAEEAAALIEVEFEYVTEIDGKNLFKKRK